MSRKHVEKETIGFLGFATALLIVLITVFSVFITALTFRSKGVQVALAAAVVLLIVGIVFIHLDRKQSAKRSIEYKEKLRAGLKPGTRFEAFGSMAQDLEGEFIRWIDSDTVEARIWDPRGGPREKGPFPFGHIKGIKELE